MSRKQLGMKRPIKQFDKAVDEMIEYINAFNFMPPRGEGAKEQAINEWKQCINNVIIQINNIKNTQIDLILRGEENDK
ncbi:MAG: hypothetical protein HFI86_05745 [Bacilli bacterium]|nr:hypothetical protein [Bacilli bacterium]